MPSPIYLFSNPFYFSYSRALPLFLLVVLLVLAAACPLLRGLAIFGSRGPRNAIRVTFLFLPVVVFAEAELRVSMLRRGRGVVGCKIVAADY